MPLRLERQEHVSALRLAAAPLLALAFTLIVGAVMFVALGHDPIRAFTIYFVEPLLDPWTLQELVVKACPLLIIGVGLAFFYRVNRWHIGAEVQYVDDDILDSCLTQETQGTAAGH